MRVTLTLTVDETQIHRNYGFEFGEFEDKDWQEEVVDMFDTLLTNNNEPMSEDRTDENGLPSYE